MGPSVCLTVSVEGQNSVRAGGIGEHASRFEFGGLAYNPFLFTSRSLFFPFSVIGRLTAIFYRPSKEVPDRIALSPPPASICRNGRTRGDEKSLSIRDFSRMVFVGCSTLFHRVNTLLTWRSAFRIRARQQDLFDRPRSITLRGAAKAGPRTGRDSGSQP